MTSWRATLRSTRQYPKSTKTTSSPLQPQEASLKNKSAPALATAVTKLIRMLYHRPLTFKQNLATWFMACPGIINQGLLTCLYSIQVVEEVEARLTSISLWNLKEDTNSWWYLLLSIRNRVLHLLVHLTKLWRTLSKYCLNGVSKWLNRYSLLEVWKNTLLKQGSKSQSQNRSPYHLHLQPKPSTRCFNNSLTCATRSFKQMHY